MGTRMLLFPGDEHIHRTSSWVGMHHEPENPSWMGNSQSSSGGNTWSKRLAASSNDDSWEVRAFAEDASTSGQWPPRSYSCSFCQREFRTAQALGGHMNVHRRERAQANQLAQLRSSHTGTDAHSNNAISTPPDHHWLSSHHQPTPSTGGHDHHYHGYQSSSSRAYASSTSVEDSYGPATSFGAPSFRNSSPYESSAWRYDTPRDSGLDLELRLGQRYD